MRTSNDVYKLPNGKMVSLGQDVKSPQGARIWSGYDYQNQYWVHNGERDTRTLEELKKVIDDRDVRNCHLCGSVEISGGWCSNSTCAEYRRYERSPKTKHSPAYDNLVPSAIFDIEDSDEIAEAWGDMFGY